MSAMNGQARSELKSSAVVKFSRDARGVVEPVKFSELAVSTNLREPPRNWLEGDQIPKGGRHRHRMPDWELPSLSMASQSLDSLGKVDVITDSENVKKLIKMGFGGPGSSMLVHRLGRTLCIDALDSHRALLKLQEQDWPWIQSLLQEAKAALPPPPASLDEGLLQSKFLYHSIKDAAEPKASPPAVIGSSAEVESAVLPDPLEEGSSTPASSHSCFQREVMWTFEDLRMLLGSNLPIFGSGTHPCVTLRLRDSERPINVLTGLDYWLDGLMCNVPEVAMCYHLDGFVQKYEVVETAELPRMPGSSFDPGVVKNLAGNLLSFLKDNATKEGHTYWLFKPEDDDVVKLYDLSSLVPESSQSPFRLPVASLMYRLGRNLLRDAADAVPARPARGLFNSAYRLLQAARQLLQAEDAPRLLGSIHYLLANLYLAFGTGGAVDSLEEDGELPVGWELQDEAWEETPLGQPSLAVSMDLLKLPPPPPSADQEHSNRRPLPLPNSTNLDDCCKQALEHVYEGLEIAGSESIDLRCILLIQAAGAYKLQAEAAARLDHGGRALRLCAAGLSCLEGVGVATRTGEASRMLKRCEDLERGLLPSLLALIGDVLLLFAKQDRQTDGARMGRELARPLQFRDRRILERARELLGDSPSHFDQLTNPPVDAEEALSKARKACEGALEELRKERPPSKFLRFMMGGGEPKKGQVLRQLGNILNEMGSRLTNQATMALSSESLTPMEMEGILKTAQAHFDESRAKFKEAGDKPNLALILSNSARIERIYSRRAFHPGQPFSPAERRHIQKAIQLYEKALEALSGDGALRPSQSEAGEAAKIGDVVSAELAGTFFTLASQLQERPPLASSPQAEVEREITANFRSSLRQYELLLDRPSPLLPQALLRTFLCHSRLASLSHKALRDKGDMSSRKAKTLRTTTENSYQSAEEAYLRLARSKAGPRTPGTELNFLRTQMERLALYEFILANGESGEGKAPSNHWRDQRLLACLQLLGSSEKSWIYLSETMEKEEEEEMDEDAEETAEVKSLSKIWLERSQEIAKAYLQMGKDGGASQSDLTSRKSLFKATLTAIDKLKPRKIPAAISNVAKSLSALLQARSVLVGY